MSKMASISFYLKTNTIRIHLSTYYALSEPKFIQLMTDDNLQTLIIKTYDRKTFKSFRIPKVKNHPDAKIDIGSKMFCRALAQQMGWDTGASYRVPGKPYTVQGVAAFDLRNATVINAKPLRAVSDGNEVNP